MSDKKNIDRLFQERFKDFEAEPSEQVWENIEAALKKDKKERKIIPFWWRFSGIAAALVIGFFVMNGLFNSDAVSKNPTTIINNNEEVNTTENPIVNSTKDAPKPKNDNAAVRLNAVNPDTNQALSKASDASKSSAVAVGKLKNSSESTTQQTVNSKDAVALKSNHKSKKQGKSTTISTRNATDAIVLSNSKKQNSEQPKSEIAASSTANEKTNSEGKVNFVNQNTVAVNQENQKEFIQNNISNDTFSIAKNNAVATEKSTEDKKLEATDIATVVPNALEELLKENEKEKKMIAETNVNRWQITSSVAPIYFSSTSNGSPIHSQFAENDKTYENNLSFGLGVNYAVTKKISIRTGINRLTMGYNTNDVSFAAGLQSSSLGNINPAPNAGAIEVVNQDVVSEDILPFESDLQNMNTGAIRQRMGYIELPMEMSYKLVDKKIGITLIGGMSTLFLNENNVALVSPGWSTNLGTASNLNDIHFSSNFGVGFKYSFWKAFELNFEPMFKYQINTFSNDAGNFKPYFIGLYSGVSFNF